MGTVAVTPKVGRKPKVMTPLQKKIADLQKLRSANKSTESQDNEYSDLTAEQKRLDLARLGTARVSKALKAIQQIKNLARFKPSESQRNKVFGALKNAIESAHSAWEGTSSTTEDFSLDK